MVYKICPPNREGGRREDRTQSHTSRLWEDSGMDNLESPQKRASLLYFLPVLELIRKSSKRDDLTRESSLREASPEIRLFHAGTDQVKTRPAHSR